MRKGAKNVSASVRDRLLRLARERGEVFELVLVRYANERLLYRLSKSRHASRFVFEGRNAFHGLDGRSAPCQPGLPVLLDHEPPRLRAYPRETVVAEKLEAMVQLGLANTRLKDLFDLAVLAREFEFDGEVLVAAIRATFERRGTTLPTSLPVALTPTFTKDSAKQTQWVAFGRKSGVASIGELPAVAGEIAAFVGAPLDAAANGASFPKSWKPGGPWK